MNAFRKLAVHVQDEASLKTAYGELVSLLFERDYWSPGLDGRRRILWHDGHEAREQLSTDFKLPGIYLWGVRETPLYIGRTGSSFRKRFNRYIWGTRSQCKLAQRYEEELIEHGLEGFPEEVHEWYSKNFGSSTVRLRGAVAFARHGIEDIWFSLLPQQGNAAAIERLESALIPVAAAWNEEQGQPPLLNVEYL